MKISKTGGLVLVAGILIITSASLGFARSEQVAEQNHLDEELFLAQLRLNATQFTELSSRQEELEQQLSETISDTEAVRAIFYQPTVGVATSDTLFSIARGCGVEVIETSSSDLLHDDLEEITYSVLPLTATVEGDVPNLINFIVRLNDNFSNGVIKAVTLNIPVETETDAETEEEQPEEETETEKPSADISLVIYTYRGG